MSHALLTLEYLTARRIAILGAVLNDAWEPTAATYRDDVAHVLAPHTRVLGILPFEPDAAVRIAADAATVSGAFAILAGLPERNSTER